MYIPASNIPATAGLPPPNAEGGNWSGGANAFVDQQIHGSIGNIFLGGNTPEPNSSSYTPFWSTNPPSYSVPPASGTYTPTTGDPSKPYEPGQYFKDYKPPTLDNNSILNAMQPGPDNPSYKASLDKWKQTDPQGAAEFEKNVQDGLGGQDRKEWIVNNLQMAVHNGKISKQDAANLIGNGPAASLYDFSAPGTDHANAGAYALSNGMGGPLGGDSADPWNEPIPSNLSAPGSYGDFTNPGKDNPGYKAAMEHWKKTNPDKAAAFEKNIDEGNAGAKGRNKQVVNDLQMAVHRGEISEQDAQQLIRGGPAASWFNFDSPGHNGTSAGAYALGNALGGDLGGASGNPKSAGDKYIASQVFSLGGLLPNPLSNVLNPLG